MNATSHNLTCEGIFKTRFWQSSVDK